MTSPLLSVLKERYFTRLSVDVDPDLPSFGESRWIVSEDVNVEHLLDVFTSVDPDSEGVWNACANFLNHLHWHKPRLTVLGPKIETLSDNHPSKAPCSQRSRTFVQFGWKLRREQTPPTYTLKLWRERGDDFQVAETLSYLSNVNRLLDLEKEAIGQAREAMEIFERLGDTANQADCFIELGQALYDDNQIDAAEEAALRGIELLRENSEQFTVCQAHRLLGNIYSSKGETDKAVHHFETALGIATTLGLPDDLFWIHYSMAEMFSEQDNFVAAHDHIERAMLHADNPYKLGRATELRAEFWFKQGMFEKARLEASRAADVYGKIGATKDIEDCRALLERIDRLNLSVPGEPPHKRCHLLRVLTRRFKVGKPTESTGCYPNFTRFRPTVHDVSQPSHPQLCL
jgi:tetratricopeptide (TPR) repeat protein